MTGLDFPVLGWVVLSAAAVLVGIAKTSFGGLGVVAVAAFALYMPARESTAAVLLVLILGDVIAVCLYRKAVDRTILLRLLPAVLPGILLGALVIRVVDDRTMTLVIALCLLAAIAVQVAMRRRRTDPQPDGAGEPDDRKPRLLPAAATGAAAGFTTMIANAAGPVMALYLLATRVDKVRFLATNAWFFLLVNVSKVPFSAGLGLLPASTWLLTAILAPGVVLGTWLGRRLLGSLPQSRFETFTLAAAVLSASLLLAQAAWGD